ncbi:MAG: alpha-amylase [Thermoanaerobaculia bacterium]|nr:alpha-amylase [Thermoanaerobaculia bacterium]
MSSTTFKRLAIAVVAVLGAADVLVSPSALAATQQNTASTAIVMQGFHWNSSAYSYTWYDKVSAKASDMKDLGITHVWFPPPSDAASAEGYLPRQLNLLDSKYGTEAQLKSAISALNGQGIKSIADIVINHRVGTSNWADFTNPAWDCRSVVNNDEWTGRCGNGDSGDGYSAARDIDHSQTFVQDSLKTWMSTKLKAAGFSGIRYDYSKGYAPSYAKVYHDAWSPDFCVGEVWTNLDYNNVDAHRQLLMNYIDGTAGTCAAFDFTTKGLLNQALAYNEYWRLRDGAGKPAGAIGWWPQKSVTFVDNHDTGPSETCGNGQNHWPVPCSSVLPGYAYILTHPGIPTVYWPHVYDWGLRSSVKALIDVRKAAGITSTSAVSIQAAQNGLYAAIITGTVNQVAMKIGPNDWNPGTGWTLKASGTNYAVWTKGSAPVCNVNVTFTIANANTSWGQSLYVVGNQTSLGNWSPAASFKLTIQGTGSNATWSGTVAVPAGKAVQYKYVKFNGSTAVWESNQATPSGNREFTTPGTCGSSVSRSDGNFKF